jgi:hypothetical protein
MAPVEFVMRVSLSNLNCAAFFAGLRGHVQNAEDIVLAHDEVLGTGEDGLAAGVLSEQDPVADFTSRATMAPSSSLYHSRWPGPRLAQASPGSQCSCGPPASDHLEGRIVGNYLPYLISDLLPVVH